MVKKISAVALGIGLGFSSLLWSEPLRVQSALAPVKASSELNIGQRFECLDNVRLECFGCPLYFTKGTIGLRVSETEFFLAQGQVRIGAWLPSENIGARQPEIIIGFYRGRLQATGLEWLNLNHDDEVRWFKEANTRPSRIEIDGLAYGGEEQTLLLATREACMTFDRGVQKEITPEDMEQSTLAELSLRFHRRRDTSRAVAVRPEGATPSLIQPIPTLERNRGLTFGRRYGARQ